MPRATSAASIATKDSLLAAAIDVIRAKGYSATRVEDICNAAGVTKGGFFHHFATKEEIAIAAAQYFSDQAESLFLNADYQNAPDPLQRVLGYVDFRRAIISNELPAFTCLLGTMAQETYVTHPAIRQACERFIGANAEMVERDLVLAIEEQGMSGPGDARGLSLYIQAAIQGAFVLAKANNDPALARQCLDHLYCYLELLFTAPKTTIN